jgi:hypothetical protein
VTKAANPGTYQLTFNSSDGLYHSSPILPPQQVTGLAVGSISTSSISLSWSVAQTGTYPIAGYNVYQNGTLLTTTTLTTYTAVGLSPATAYTYQVSAYDNRTPPNTGANSAQVGATTNSVASAPGVATGLTVGAITANTIVLTWNVAPQGTYPIAGYYMYLNGVNIAPNGRAPINGIAQYTYGLLSPGTSYTLAVQAYDNQTPQNVGAVSASVQVTTSAAAGTGAFTALPGFSLSQTTGVGTGTVQRIKRGMAQ